MMLTAPESWVGKARHKREHRKDTEKVQEPGTRAARAAASRCEEGVRRAEV